MERGDEGRSSVALLTVYLLEGDRHVVPYMSHISIRLPVTRTGKEALLLRVQSAQERLPVDPRKVAPSRLEVHRGDINQQRNNDVLDRILHDLFARVHREVGKVGVLWPCSDESRSIPVRHGRIVGLQKVGR